MSTSGNNWDGTDQRGGAQPPPAAAVMVVVVIVNDSGVGASNRGPLPHTLEGRPADNIVVNVVGFLPCVHSPAHPVAIRPDGYQQTNPLPQIPTKQSVPTSREVLPGYFGLPIRIPTLRSLIGPAIGKS
jgi:hypothetical protein